MKSKHTDAPSISLWRRPPVIASIITLVIAVLVLWAVILHAATTDTRAGIDPNRYQIVQLTTGETYIGKLSGLANNYVTLSDVYYQQTAPATDTASTSQVTVLKLSDSVAKPDDTMRIATDKIVHWENLSADSKIVKAISTGQQQ